MARKYNGSTDAAQSGSALDLTSVSQLSVAFWAWVDTSSNAADSVVLETSANFISNAGAWVFDFNNASNPGKSVLAYFGVGLSYCLYTRASAAAWHHYVLLLDPTAGSNNCTVYLDGSIPGSLAHGDLVNAGNMGNHKLNLFARNAGASLPEAGRIAELGLWPGLLLSANDITSLYAGYRPPKIRPDKLGWYYPCGYPTATSEPELVKANALTLTGTSSADHPRILY